MVGPGEPVRGIEDDLDQYMVQDQEQPEPEPEDEPEDEPEPADEPIKTAGPGAFSCPTCGREFESQRGLSRHVTDIHGRPGRPPTSSQNPRGTGRPKARPKAPAAPPARRSNQVQLLLNYAYMGGGMAFAAFGPKPEPVRQIVGTSMVMTAGPAAGGLARTARRFSPLYAILEAIAGVGAGAEDLSAVGVPLLLGLYGYAKPQSRAKIQPFVAGALTQLLCMVFGVEMPVQEQAMDLLQGIERTPEGMQEMAMTLLGALDSATEAAEPNHAAAPAA